MINDLLIYAHPPVSVAPQGQVNPDFQIVEDPMVIVNRTSTAPDVVTGVFDVATCSVVTGGQGGAGLLNQNTSADAALWIPPLRTSEAQDSYAVLASYQRVTFTYQSLVAIGPEPEPLGPFQTCFIGHYPRTSTPNIEIVRPYTYYTDVLTLAPGAVGVAYIHVQPSYDMLVEQFYTRSAPLGCLVGIRDTASGRNITNEPVYAELIAYRDFVETQNYRQPFMPWVAPKDHRYRIEFTNTTGTEQKVQFAFAGRLCIVH